MARRSVTLRCEQDQVTVDLAGEPPVVLRDVIAFFPKPSGRLKIVSVGEAPEQVRRAPETPEERAAVERSQFVPVFRAEDFSLVLAEAYLRYVFFTFVWKDDPAPQRPPLRLEARALDALAPETRRAFAALLKKFGQPAFLNGRRL